MNSVPLIIFTLSERMLCELLAFGVLSVECERGAEVFSPFDDSCGCDMGWSALGNNSSLPSSKAGLVIAISTSRVVESIERECEQGNLNDVCADKSVRLIVG